MKRAVFGTHHSISEAHLPRYLAEWDFKWNARKIIDGERAAKAKALPALAAADDRSTSGWGQAGRRTPGLAPEVDDPADPMRRRQDATAAGPDWRQKGGCYGSAAIVRGHSAAIYIARFDLDPEVFCIDAHQARDQG